MKGVCISVVGFRGRFVSSVSLTNISGSVQWGKVTDRFWAQIDRSGDCWIWTGYRTSKGYGRFKVGGRHYRAHRVAWVLAYGPIPDEVDVLHHCDTPPCVRDTHLFLGDEAANAHDRDSKGRLRIPCLYGEANPNARLTVAQVAEMRARHQNGATAASIARAFRVDRSYVSVIVRGKRRQRG